MNTSQPPAEFCQHRTLPIALMGGVIRALLIAFDLHFGRNSALDLYSDSVDDNSNPGKTKHSLANGDIDQRTLNMFLLNEKFTCKLELSPTMPKENPVSMMHDLCMENRILHPYSS
jgi:hypothetical protein